MSDYANYKKCMRSVGYVLFVASLVILLAFVIDLIINYGIITKTSTILGTLTLSLAGSSFVFCLLKPGPSSWESYADIESSSDDSI